MDPNGGSFNPDGAFRKILELSIDPDGFVRAVAASAVADLRKSALAEVARAFSEGSLVGRLAAFAKSSYVKAMAALLSGSKDQGARFSLTQDLGFMMRGARAATTDLPGDVISARVAAEAGYAVVASAVPIRVALADESLVVELTATESSIEVRAVSPAIENSGRRVLVELLRTDADPLSAVVQMMEQEAADRAAGETSITLVEPDRSFSDAIVLIAWVS